MVTIIDYGIGNLRSIEKAFERVGANVERTDDPASIRDAERLVLPGVGAFGACIDELRSRDLESVILDRVGDGIPFLGVCVGMQLLFDTGREKGTHEGLGLLPGEVVHFHRAEEGRADDLKVPHMGWNTLDPTAEPDHVLATTDYGHSFPAMVRRDNIYGVQFHPEKSQSTGLRILENFARLPRTVPS
jgi:glutamine amidotransferase